MGTDIVADDIDALRIYLKLSSIRLIGHSGRGIALEYAERHPNSVDNIILLDPGILGDRDGAGTMHFLSLWHDDPRYSEAIAAQEGNDKKDAAPATDKEFEHYLSAVLPMYFSAPDRSLYRFLQTYANTHLSSYTMRTHSDADQRLAINQPRDYNKIRAKTLIMNGTVDGVCPPEAAQRAHVGIKGSILSLHASAGHVLSIEQPQRFFAEVTKFLNN